MEDCIRAEGLSKSYSGRPAVNGLTLSAPQGTAFGLLGANGAGKSTAIECLLGTKQPDRGTVSILGMDPRSDRKKLFQRVGIQFQEARWQDKITVGELCEVTASLYRRAENIPPLLDQLGIADKARRPVEELSGGERQRLFIVLALLPRPDVVFLDELTTGLDARARRDVWKILARRKSEGLTILLTSHFMDEVEALCDRILILKRGQTVFAGTPAEAAAASPFDRFEDAYLWYTDEEEPR